MLTFKQALEKYRADQARDERGRFTSEGGGSIEEDGKAYDILQRGALNVSRSEWKWLAGHFRRKGNEAAARNAEHNMKTAPSGTKTDWDALDRARSRALDRTSTPITVEANERDRGQLAASADVKELSRRFDSLFAHVPTRSARVHMAALEALSADIDRAGLTRAQWHELARLTDTEVPKSTSGKRVRQRVMGRIDNLISINMKRLSRDGRSAA